MSQPRVKTALVTGASSGIGFHVAQQLHQKGYVVFACARRLEPMEPLSNQGIHTFQCDVTNLQEVLELKKKIQLLCHENHLDLLYNNAGSSCTFPAIDVSDDDALLCFQTNVLAPVRITREFSDMVINAKGTIAFTGSIAGIVPFPLSCIYGASKAAIHQYCQTLHLEMKMFDVKVLNFITGAVDTNIGDTRDLPESSLFNNPEGLAILRTRQKMAVENQPQSPETYAKIVVKDVLNARTHKINIYRGTGGYILPLLIKWIPRWIIEAFLMRKFNMYGFWNKIISDKKKKKD